MHGLCCNSLIHLLVDPFISSPVRLLRSPQYREYHTEYLRVDQGSLSYLINSLSHSHDSMWPEADARWQYFTTNRRRCGGQKIFISVIFCIYIMWWRGHISLLEGGGGRSARQRDGCCQHRDSVAALASAFLPRTYVGCRGPGLSQAVALLGASWCERMGSMWLVDKNAAVACMCVKERERERERERQKGRRAERLVGGQCSFFTAASTSVNRQDITHTFTVSLALFGTRERTHTHTHTHTYKHKTRSSQWNVGKKERLGKGGSKTQWRRWCDCAARAEGRKNKSRTRGHERERKEMGGIRREGWRWRRRRGQDGMVGKEANEGGRGGRRGGR